MILVCFYCKKDKGEGTMDLIDNRYKVQSIQKDDLYNVSYEVIDFWNEDKRLLMTLYNTDRQAQVIDYFIDNFIYLCKIEHKYLLGSHQFNIIRTIDRKRTNIKQYYVTTEYNDRPSLDRVYLNLNFNERLNILMQVCMVLDFLHQKGIVYKHLSPSNIFLMEDGSIKIKDLSTIYENTINANYDDLTRYFIAPEVLLGHEDIISDNADKYSLGMLIKYLFMENFYIDDNERLKYSNTAQLNCEQIKFLDKTTINWTKKNSIMRKGSLIAIIDKISKMFNIEYKHHLKEEREFLNFDTKIVGREKELKKILNISHRFINETYSNNYILINGSQGVGKTRLLREVDYQLKIRGRDAYFIQVMKDDNSNINSMINILRQTIQDAPENLLNKYRNELVKILPELKLTLEEKTFSGITEDIEKLRLYDRMTKYLEELSMERPICLIIDDVIKASPRILYLFEYMKDNINKGNILLILSYNEKNIEEGTYKEEFVNKLKADKKTQEIELYNLNLQGIEELIQHILGISYRPLRFSAFMLKESQGNPERIEKIIKNLFATGELFCNFNGNWNIKTKKYSDIHISINEDESIESQMALIKEDYMDIMRVISICNSSISKEALLSILDISIEDLNIKLDELIEMKLLDKRVADWGYSYSISNMQFEKLIYHNISKNKRIELHKKMALYLEEEYRYNHNILLGELIYHLRSSEQMAKALDYIVRDAKENLEIYSSQSILRWEEAYEISKTIDSKYRFEILKNLGKAYFNKGKNHRALKIYSELLYESMASSNSKYVIIARIGMGNIYLKRNLIVQSLKEVKSAIKISKEIEWLDGFVQAQILFNQILKYEGKIEEIEKNMKKLLDFSMINNLEKGLGSIYNMLGIANYYNGNIEQAMEYYNKSILFFRKIGKTIESIKPMNNIANIYLEYHGNNKKAMEYYREALKIAENHRVFSMEMKLLNNIGKNHMSMCEYDKAIGYIEKAKIMSMDMEDASMIFSTNINLGLIYLLIGDCDRSYNSYTIIREISRKNGTYSLGRMGQYYKYLGEFYFQCGKWDKSMENLKKAMDIYGRYNRREYLIAKSKLVFIEYLKKPTYDKSSIEDIRIQIRNANLGFYRRRLLLYIAIVSYFKKDYKYALDILKEDEELKENYPLETFDYVSKILSYVIGTEEDSYEYIIQLGEDMTKHKYPYVNVLSNALLGFKFSESDRYYQAINYLLEALDLLYRLIKNIPDRELQVSYIKSKKGDYIKRKIVDTIYKISGYRLEYLCIEDLDSKDDIQKYFDYSSLFALAGDENFVKAIEPYYDYKGIENIYDLETLVSNLTNDYEYNIKLILKYLSKETLAQKGYVLFYDDEYNRYLPIISLNSEIDQLPNENLLALANRSERGILISNNLGVNTIGLYKGFLSENTRALLCIPIRASAPNRFYKNEKRRKRKESNNKNNGYIYLETSKIFNRFDDKSHDLACVISRLININMENYKFKILSTMDKLTGTYTRKYFENEFKKVIDEARKNKESFALIMIDVDRFKNINDTYGHRKGDEILSKIGYHLINSVRNTDLVARYGGEEFIIIIRNVKEEEAKRVGEKIRTNIEKIKIPRIKESVTISLGISMYPRHGQLKEDLIEKADQALYGAKKKGRNMTMVWNAKVSDSVSRVDRLAGIISGNINKDQRNTLSILDIIELTNENISKEEKIFKFLGRIIEILEAQNCSLILIDEEGKIEYTYTRSRLNKSWTQNKFINYNIVKRVVSNKAGEFLIDWENIRNVASITHAPEWQSIIVIPLISKERVKAIVYITVPIKEKEFDYNSYNLSKVLSDIFSSVV